MIVSLAKNSTKILEQYVSQSSVSCATRVRRRQQKVNVYCKVKNCTTLIFFFFFFFRSPLRLKLIWFLSHLMHSHLHKKGKQVFSFLFVTWALLLAQSLIGCSEYWNCFVKQTSSETDKIKSVSVMQWRFYKDCMALTVLPRAQLFWVFWKMVTDDNKIPGVFLEFSRVDRKSVV